MSDSPGRFWTLAEETAKAGWPAWRPVVGQQAGGILPILPWQTLDQSLPPATLRQPTPAMSARRTTPDSTSTRLFPTPVRRLAGVTNQHSLNDQPCVLRPLFAPAHRGHRTNLSANAMFPYPTLMPISCRSWPTFRTSRPISLSSRNKGRGWGRENLGGVRPASFRRSEQRSGLITSPYDNGELSKDFVRY